MASLEVEVLSRKLIKPSNPTPQDLQKLGLSLFDQLAIPWYFNVILYYTTDDDESTITKKTDEERRAQLEKSLSDALPSLFLLSGRFIEEDFAVDCRDQGVEYVEARVNCKLPDFLQKGPRIELLDKFLPWESFPPPKSSASPLIAIQANAFNCGGLVLGIQISHVVADAASLGLFVDAWARTSRASIANIPYFRHFIAENFPARISSEEKALLPMLPVPKPIAPADREAKIVTARFLFDQKAIAQIIENAAKAKGGSNSIANIKTTKVVVALGLLWKAFMAMAVAKHGYMRDSALCIAMNLRGKVSLQVPEESFGNFCVSVLVPFEGNKDSAELYDLIILVRDAIRDISARVSQASNDGDVSSILIGCRRALIEKWDQERAGLLDVYLCSSWRGFTLYEADFGWGKPFWVSVATQHSQGVWIMDGNKDDAIEVWVSLEEKDMIEFKRDPDIVAFLSTNYE